MSTTRSTTLNAVIVAGLVRRRDERDLTQDQVAERMRDAGFGSWTRSVVAAFEKGARQLDLGELLGLCAALDSNLAAVLADAGEVAISDALAIEGSRIADVVDGRSEPHTRDDFVARMLPDIDAGLRRLAGRIGVDPMVVVAEAQGEAEQKLARRLDTRAVFVAFAARRRWGRSLSAERDARTEARLEPGQSAQAVRGHVTRQLVAELRPDIDRFRNRKENTR